MRRKDLLGIAVVAGAFLVLVASTLWVLETIEELWVQRRAFYQVSELLAVPFGGNRDVPVLLFVGVLGGWFLLFWVDATKRVQGAILSVAVLTVGWYLLQLDRILGAIDRTGWALVVGLVIGVGSGVLSARKITADQPGSLLERLQWLRYPGATMAFKHSATATVVVTVVDFVLISPGFRETMSVVSVAVMFLVSLSVFIEYAHERRVITVSPPDDGDAVAYQPYVLGGLYGLASRRYGAESTGRGDIGGLNDASVAMSARGLQPFTDDVSFTFPSAQLQGTKSGVGGMLTRLKRLVFPQPITIESADLTTRRIGTPDVPDSSGAFAVYGRFFVERLVHHVVALTPQTIRERVPSGGTTSIGRLDRADTVLLIGPTPAEAVDAEWADSFAAICRRYASRPGTDVVLASVEAGPVAEQEGLPVSDGSFRSRLSRWITGGAGALSINDVYPLDRFTDEQESERQFAALLERLCD